MSTNLSWREVTILNRKITWKIGTAMSGGFKRNFYGWSYGCRFGGVMFLRLIAT